MRQDHKSPEQSLWASVLLLVIEDALYGAGSVGLQSRAERIHATNDARTYLTRPNRDFDIVCSLAGVDPIATRERLTKQIAAAPSVEELLSKPKRQAVMLTHNGETLTLREWSERTGIKAGTLASRLQQGWSIERTLTAPTGQRYQGVKLTYNGETLSPREWSERTGIPEATIRRRMGAGIPPERVLTPGRIPQSPNRVFNKPPSRPARSQDQVRNPGGRPAKLYAHNGENLTLIAWSERTGIVVGTLRTRLKMGWSIERALTAPIQEQRR